MPDDNANSLGAHPRADTRSQDRPRIAHPRASRERERPHERQQTEAGIVLLRHLPEVQTPRANARSTPRPNQMRMRSRTVRASQGVRACHSAWRTLQGIETMNMIRKGQVRWLPKSDIAGQAAFVGRMFGLTLPLGSVSHNSL